MSKPREFQIYANSTWNRGYSILNGVKYTDEPDTEFNVIEKWAYEELEKKLAIAIEALEGYAKSCWYPNCYDEGWSAKEALEQIKGDE